MEDIELTTSDSCIELWPRPLRIKRWQSVCRLSGRWEWNNDDLQSECTIGQQIWQWPSLYRNHPASGDYAEHEDKDGKRNGNEDEDLVDAVDVALWRLWLWL